MKAIEKVKALRDELSNAVFEREEQIVAMIAAILAGVHVLLLGPPGTAKSMLANLLCSAIEGGQFFQWLLTKFSTPEELFGPLSLKGLENDEYRRVTSGKLPEAHIAFLDEIFKANSAILNSLLTLINERKFHNNGHGQAVPLISCVGASNELPQGEELGALYDRFALRFWVDCLQDDNAFQTMLNSSPTTINTKLTLKDIEELQKAVEAVNVPQDVIDNILAVRRELRLAGITVSDRRWKGAVKILKAYAVLDERDELTNDDLESLVNILWNHPEQRNMIMKSVAPYANPFNKMAVEKLDAAKELYDNWTKQVYEAQNMLDETSKNRVLQEAALQTNGALKEILKEIEKDLKDRPENRVRKLKETRDQIKKWQKEVIVSLGV